MSMEMNILLSPLRITFHNIEADFYTEEFKNKKARWLAVNASSHYRKCGKSAIADQLLNAIKVNPLKNIKLKSAIYTTHGGVKRDFVQFLKPSEWNKRVWASIENTAESVIEAGFIEALQRDPTQQRHWVVLVDGHPHQIRLINRVMKKHNIKATIVMDFIHVLEYVWKAVWCFYEKGDDDVEAWADKIALKILRGDSNQVAKGMRISATKRCLTKRESIDKCADYLLKNKLRLQYGEALKKVILSRVALLKEFADTL